MPLDANRELIMEALALRVSGAQFSPMIADAQGWRTFSRRLKLWGDVEPQYQPAAYLVEHDEAVEQPGRGMPAKRYMHASLFCYARTDDESIVGGTLLNQMLTAVEDTVRPDNGTADLCTLGGLVYWCQLVGRVFKVPGDIDNQAMMVVPFRMLVP